MSFDSITAILILQHIKGIGPSRLQQLLNHFGTPQNILSASRDELAVLGSGKLLMQLADQLALIQDKAESHALAKSALKEREYCDQHGVEILTMCDAGFPPLLKEAPASPSLLYVKGNVHALKEPQLAMVGARNASIEGLNNAKRWAHELAAAGLTITSGLAEGIDGAAHLGALDASGSTIAVVAHGLDTLYPRCHQTLSENILASGGAIVSEFAIGIVPKREYFPRRNRIISGLSLGVCVIEAAIKSGSLITARYAIEQNREVFALPSHINNVMAEGCHYLIQQGAELVTKPEHILSHLSLSCSNQCVINESDADLSSAPASEEDSFFEIIPFSATHFDEILINCSLPAHQVSAKLMALEMSGKVAVESGFYRRIV